MNSTTLNALLATLGEALRRMAPYLLTEILLPGGTVIAMLLFLSRYRRGRRLKKENAMSALPADGVAGAQPASN